MRKNLPAKSRPDVPPGLYKPWSLGSLATRPLFVACVAGAVGCSAPQVPMRYGPPPFGECPPGSRAVIKRLLSNEAPYFASVVLPGGDPDEPNEPVLVEEGEVEVTTYLQDNWEGVPPGSVIEGVFVFGDRLYGRFTRLRLPNGEELPFCGNLLEEFNLRPGVAWVEGSKPGAMKVHGVLAVGPQRD